MLILICTSIPAPYFAVTGPCVATSRCMLHADVLARGGTKAQPISSLPWKACNSVVGQPPPTQSKLRVRQATHSCMCSTAFLQCRKPPKAASWQHVLPQISGSELHAQTKNAPNITSNPASFSLPCAVDDLRLLFSKHSLSRSQSFQTAKKPQKSL